MSMQKDLLRRMATAITAGDTDNVDQWFTEDFALHDPAIGQCLYGHEGARQMLQMLAETVPEARLEILDMVEEGDQVAVRWRFVGGQSGASPDFSVMAIYRFEGGRIAEDWGVGNRAAWP